MAWTGKQYTVTASAASMTSILGLDFPTIMSQCDIFAKSTNTGDVFAGGANVTNAPANARVDIIKGNGYSFVPSSTNVGTDEVYIVGTASDVVYISVVIP